MTALSMQAHPMELLDVVKASTDRLMATAEELEEEELRQPSLLPGWSRAHVLTHLARGADSRRRLLLSARIDATIEQYPDEETREREINEGAQRPRSTILADLRTSAELLTEAIAQHPNDRWDELGCWLGARERPVREVVSTRLQELEIHHADLNAGYGHQAWPHWFVAEELQRTVDEMSDTDEVAPVTLHATDTGTGYQVGNNATVVIRGAQADLFAWLIGRSSGHRLLAEPGGVLPSPPSWR
ncbi:maleylpyruvate isomerase family mycothiol-dependent enzyme [Actinoplanes sp. NPDC051475]|uniref:maleylpyruvate isomerase family mycothiol-dependent enzyme n=1 Tax=Actinoplanes sp. NPDC051475 TaxID=3157225 RepID=UPI00344BF064